PLFELLGGELPDGQPGPPWPAGLNLTRADIPRLAPYLRDDWYMLAVGFWRDFHPSRYLETTRPIVAALINRLARRDLCKVRQRGPERAKAWAPPYLSDRNPSVRFAAALIVFRTGDKAAARKVLGDALEAHEVDYWTVEAVRLLLTEGSPESVRAAARVFLAP